MRKVMIKHFYPKCMPKSSAPFSQVVIDDHYVHLAGIVAADFPEGLDVLGDVFQETKAILIIIENILQELNLNLSSVVRTDVHLSDLGDFDRMDSAYREFFESGKYPARTTTQSNRLFGNSRVEITCMVQK